MNEDRGTGSVIAMPVVSIVLPTYNRAAMLAEGLESITAQTFDDWELIVVDDGSTDRNREVVEEFQARVSQPVTYIYQENQGPGVARQRALGESRGELIAFMDSDDPWLPHHLQDSVEVLRSNSDVDWVVGPARVVNELTGEVVHENSYFPEGKPRQFLALNAERRGKLFALVDPRFPTYVIEHQFPGGLQMSVLRRRIIEEIRFLPLKLFDDTAFLIEMVARGHRVGYFQDVHIVYRIHAENTSLVAGGTIDYDRRIRAYRDAVQAFRTLIQSPGIADFLKPVLKRRLSRELFWSLGYAGYLPAGREREAMQCLWEGLSLARTDLPMWKTYLVQRGRQLYKRMTRTGIALGCEPAIRRRG